MKQPHKNRTFKIISNISTQPTILLFFILFIFSNIFSLTTLYAAPGNLKWRYETGESDYGVISSPAIGLDGTVYVGSHDKHVYAITAEGNLKWRYETGGAVISSPAIGSDGTVYVGSSDNYVYAITAEGKLKWRYETGRAVESSLAIGLDGTVYVGSYDDYVYAITAEGKMKWRYETGRVVKSSPAIGLDGTVYVGSRDGNVYALESGSGGGMAGYASSPWPKFGGNNGRNFSVRYKVLSKMEASEQAGYFILGEREKAWKLLEWSVSGEMNRWLNPPPPEPGGNPDLGTPPTAPVIADIPLIPEPELPPLPKKESQKDPFETKASFEKRLHKLVSDRNKQIAAITDAYRKKVKTRNLKVKAAEKKYREEYQLYLKKVAAYKKSANQIIARYEAMVAQRRTPSEKSRHENAVTLKHFNAIFGEPKLKSLTQKDGSPKYLPEEKRMFSLLYWGKADEPYLSKEYEFIVPPDNMARSFYTKMNSLKPKTELAFNRGSLQVKSISVVHQKKNYLGKVAKGYVEKEAIQVSLIYESDQNLLASISGGQNKVTLDRLKENLSVIDVESEIRKPELQSSYVKDKALNVRLSQELSDFNDDIPQLLEKVKLAEKNSKKWLFVIGLEDYKNSGKIDFSRRSAELFTEAMMKVKGVPPENVYLVTDDGTATVPNLPKHRVYSGSEAELKTQIKYLVRDIKEGDTIYFYYSGHGVPVEEDKRQPYIMARNSSVDFLYDEKFFRVQNLYKLLSDSKAGKVIAFMDSCFTGETDGVSVFQGKGATRLVPKNVKFNEKKMSVVTAGTKKQYSNMYADKGHRLFSYFLIKGILGNPKTVNELYKDVAAETGSQSRKLGGNNKQDPTLAGNGKLGL